MDHLRFGRWFLFFSKMIATVNSIMIFRLVSVRSPAIPRLIKAINKMNKIASKKDRKSVKG